MSAPDFEFHQGFEEILPSGFYALLGKRLFDIGMIVLMAPIIVPFLFVILLATALCGGAPLYSQQRIGLNGRPFRCWKVRTMVPEADAHLDRILHANPDMAHEWKHSQKLKNDPRVTPFGALLRKTSMDELPQLWNVLCGTMSLVGPRPFLPDQARLYLGGRRDADYYRMVPGITGLWQVSRRNSGSFAERAGCDSAYHDQLGFFADLAILARTVIVVVRGTGV